MEEQRYCFGCMKPLGWDGKCHSCDFERAAYRMKKHHLPLGSTLNNGEYLVGRVLGEGGFGITYIGLHTTLQIPVAIKEYFPGGMVWRSCSTDRDSYRVEAFSTEADELFKQGKTDFLREARVLSKFGSMEGIVRTRSFFEENETAYLVMDYIEGESVKSYVSANGRLQPELCWQILREPIKALMKLHEDGLVHQDISPDNIIINLSGRGTLIDFGAVRHANAIDDRTRTAIYKQGFSAYEQLEKRGERGPWTDVYGLCATIYYMLTGQRPLDATERVFTDHLVPLSEYDLSLDAGVEKLIMEGLAVETSGRLKRLDELYNILYPEKMILPENGNAGEKTVRDKKETASGENQGLTVKMERKLVGLDNRRRRQKLVYAVAAAMVFLLAFSVGGAVKYHWGNAKSPDMVLPTAVMDHERKTTGDVEQTGLPEQNTRYSPLPTATEKNTAVPVSRKNSTKAEPNKRAVKDKNKNKGNSITKNKKKADGTKSQTTASQTKAVKTKSSPSKPLRSTAKPAGSVRRGTSTNVTQKKTGKSSTTKTEAFRSKSGQQQKTKTQKNNSRKKDENTGVKMDGDVDDFLSE